MKKKSYFKVFFLNFILMLIIPLLTIILIFWKSDQIVKNQILNYASGTLERYSELFDGAIKDMSSACLSIFAREECKKYYEYSKEDSASKYIQSYKINDLLEGINSEKYYDIFVYFSTDDKIISATKSTLKSRRYFEVYYNDGLEGHWMEFQEIINCTSSKPTLYVVNSQGETPYLCVAMNAQGVTKKNYTVCIMLHPAYVQEIYSIRDADENSSFLIYNAEKNLLIGSNVEMRNLDVLKDFSRQELENNKWYSEKDYMLRVRECDSIDGFYSYVVSSNSFWNVLSELRIFGFSGIVFCIVISIVLAYRNTLKSYRPVGDLVSRLTSQCSAKYDASKGNEFDFVSLFLDENDKRISESRGVYEEWYLLRLLRGDIAVLEENKFYQDIISFSTDRFLVCILEVDFSQEESDELQLFVIQNVFQELGDGNGKGYMVETRENEYVLLINATGDIQKLVDDLQYGQKFCEQYYHIFMTLGYSQIHENVQSIPECYREAKEAMRYRYLFGQGSIISFEQIADRKKQRRLDTENRALMFLQKYIVGGKNDKSVGRFIEEFFCMYGINETASMDSVEAFKDEVFEALNVIISKCGKEGWDYNDQLSMLLEQPTLISFKTYLSYLIQNIQDEETSGENDELLAKTKVYIDEYYWNPALSVTMLGEVMGVRGKYLSKIFKEKYQISLPDYLLQVRIQQAKIYLAQKDVTIQEVAEATGFLSSQVFIRNFKNQEGITPGKFKEMI